ncbi:uncharacterized protein LOC134279131 isoform X3 [Saccostrea cucullata]|uniref:uncharacterized protein LOC134279131 isoform X3 n=1 Tax=Saccostrea cuccullata TaxID=36930 RepID=UPI002ED2D82A
MKKHGRQTKTAARDSSVDERSINIPNPKQRRVQTEDNEETTDRSPTPSARRSNHPTSVNKSNEKGGNFHINTKRPMKRKTARKSKGTHLDVEYQTKRAQIMLRSSIKHTKDSKEKVNTHTNSKQFLKVKKNKEKESLSRRNQKAILKKQSRRSRIINPGVKSPTPNKSFHQKRMVLKEEKLGTNSDLNSKAESFKKSKAKMIKQNLPGNERILFKTQNTIGLTDETSAEEFFKMFLTKIDVKHHPKVGLENEIGWIHGISISQDNLVCVSHFGYTVQLRNTTGEVMKTFKLDFRPVFICCTPSGDVLITRGYCARKPFITSISREGDVKVLADLSSFASKLCGILCQDERIFVVARRPKDKNSFIIKLTENGEVEEVYPTQKSSDDFNQIISLNGQIVAVYNHLGGLIPLETNEISTRKLNKIDIPVTSYSLSASVDKFGNVIMASDTSLFIINPSLEYMHEVDTGISGDIVATAVDQENQLWFGTSSGDLYSTKYLK